MTNEQLNTALYKKMFAEQEKYRNWLFSQSPKEILNHSYEYNIREDILLSFENNDLSDAHARALLRSAKPLADLFKEYDNRVTEHMDNIWDTVESHADELHKKRENIRDER
jgi:predicted SnoaL-like aldol condensation-catalyzing enzyme